MRIDEQEFSVGDGDFFTVPAKAVHRLINTSDDR
jgi:mannose-6-phosphate isomerase-like protein (cupin superfamily)